MMAFQLTYFSLHTCIQVYRCLQPLMLCLSHQGTLNAIDDLCADFDEDVLRWRFTLLNHIDPLVTEVCAVFTSIRAPHKNIMPLQGALPMELEKILSPVGVPSLGGGGAIFRGGTQ